MESYDAGYYGVPVDFWLAKAIRDIKVNYGHNVSVGEKGKDLFKFGRNHSVGTTRATVMTLPGSELSETYVASNLITTVSSSSGSDTRQITIEGHTLSGGNLTFVVQTITLTGQTQATLTTPLARASRVYADDTSTTDLVGSIYVYEDDTSTAGVPDTDAKIHIIINAGDNQTHKASTSISSLDYWIVTDYNADLYDKTSGFAEVRLEVRRLTGVWRPVESLAVASGNTTDHEFKPYLIIRPNTDIRLTAVADGANTDVGGAIQGVLAKIL